MTKHYGHESRSSGKNLLLLDFWLTIERGLRPTVKVNADFPNNLSRNQRTINLKMELPVELFETPTISAKISFFIRRPFSILTGTISCLT